MVKEWVMSAFRSRHRQYSTGRGPLQPTCSQPCSVMPSTQRERCRTANLNESGKYSRVAMYSSSTMRTGRFRKMPRSAVT
jgi:hypothetical protein